MPTEIAEFSCNKMEAHANGEKNEEPAEKKAVHSTTTTTLGDFIPIYVPGVKKGLIRRTRGNGRFLDFLRAQPSKGWYLTSKFMGKFKRNSNNPNSAPADTATTTGRRRFRVPFVRKINWQFCVDYGKKWIRHPMNMALIVWLIFVVAGLIILGLLMLGLLNDAIPKKAVRNRWTEIMNQVLNALFTIMCLYQYPSIAHHFVILCRWNQKDMVELRMAYCKTSAKRPYERVHMAIIIVLLHVTCFSQFMLCALYWGWTSKTRPSWAENLCIGIGIGAPVMAFLYTVFGPLSRKTNPEESETEVEITSDEESQRQHRLGPGVKIVVTEPEWLGGLFDCWDDVTVAFLSFFATFCVFGWNVERLGFGNMYVHIATFLLLCIAPLLVFYISALNISNDTLQYAVGITGCVLCFCSLLYGGYWRIQMRKKFKLPGNPLCCGYPSLTDCFQWLFCWPCALAQEVRTGNFYEIEEDSFYRRNLEEEAQQALETLPREGEAGPLVEPLNTTVEFSKNSTEVSKDQTMTAPQKTVIQMEEDQQQPRS